MIKVLEMFGEPITYGGQESVVYNMLSTFNERDYKIDLFTPYYADNEKLFSMVNKFNGNLYSLGIKFKTGDNRFNLKSDVDRFLSTTNNYDVAHIHTGSLSTMLLYSMIAKKYSIKKVIVHSHTTGRRQNVIVKLRKLLLSAALRKYADIYIGCSKDAIDYKFDRRLIKNPIVVYNGIDVEKFKFNNDFRHEVRAKHNLTNEFIIGSLGRLSFEKNHLFMLNIFRTLSKHDNIRLMVVGDGPERQNIVSKCRELGIDNKVIFTGNESEAYKYYNAFDCFIMPSIYEGMPVTAIEAQISGLPTLLSENITRECCVSSATKFLPINDVDIWVKSLYDIMNSDYTNRKYSIDFNKFDKKNTYKIIENIYKT